MGKRYYCDFCNKSFPSNTENRKKHNEGLQHQNNRASYYSKFKDLATILFEEREKKTCQKYFSGGYCAFGELCRDSHRIQDQISYLENLYRIECHNKIKLEEEKVNEEKAKEKKMKRCHNIGPDSEITDFLTKEAEKALENFLPKYELPKSLKNYCEFLLPPSMKPPTFKDIINYPFSEFG